jgi:hypothetical protein
MPTTRWFGAWLTRRLPDLLARELATALLEAVAPTSPPSTSNSPAVTSASSRRPAPMPTARAAVGRLGAAGEDLRPGQN